MDPLYTIPPERRSLIPGGGLIPSRETDVERHLWEITAVRDVMTLAFGCHPDLGVCTVCAQSSSRSSWR